VTFHYRTKCTRTLSRSASTQDMARHPLMLRPHTHTQQGGRARVGLGVPHSDRQGARAAVREQEPAGRGGAGVDLMAAGSLTCMHWLDFQIGHAGPRCEPTKSCRPAKPGMRGVASSPPTPSLTTLPQARRLLARHVQQVQLAGACRRCGRPVQAAAMQHPQSAVAAGGEVGGWWCAWQSVQMW